MDGTETGFYVIDIVEWIGASSDKNQGITSYMPRSRPPRGSYSRRSIPASWPTPSSTRSLAASRRRSARR